MTPSEMFSYLMKDPDLRERAMQSLIDNFFLTDIDKDTIQARLEDDKTALEAKIAALE